MQSSRGTYSMITVPKSGWPVLGQIDVNSVPVIVTSCTLGAGNASALRTSRASCGFSGFGNGPVDGSFINMPSSPRRGPASSGIDRQFACVYVGGAACCALQPNSENSVLTAIRTMFGFGLYSVAYGFEFRAARRRHRSTGTAPHHCGD